MKRLYEDVNLSSNADCLLCFQHAFSECKNVNTSRKKKKNETKGTNIWLTVCALTVQM